MLIISRSICWLWLWISIVGKISHLKLSFISTGTSLLYSSQVVANAVFTVKPHYVNLFLAFLTILCFAWLHKTAQRPEMSSASAFWLHSLSSSCWKQQAFKTNILKRKACHDGFWSLMVLRESWWLVFIFLSLFRLTVVNKHGTLQNTLIELLVVKGSAGVTLLSWLTLRHQCQTALSQGWDVQE